MSNTKRPLIVLTHHKCASTFLEAFLNELCALNGLRMYASHFGDAEPQLQCDVSLLINATYGPLAGIGDVPMLHVVRNPLDTIVSAYYSHKATHSLEDWPQLQRQRQLLNGCAKDEGFRHTLAFLELAEFYPRTPGPLCAMHRWVFEDPRIETIRMEDLVQNVNGVLLPILSKVFGPGLQLPEPEHFTFEKLSGGRNAGEIDDLSHYRCGLPGRWRIELPADVVFYTRERFREHLSRYYPEALR